MSTQQQAWLVQPETSAEIQYEAFSRLYHFQKEEIDALILLLKQTRPDLPIVNCTVEWAVLRWRDIEAQDILAQKYEEN